MLEAPNGASGSLSEIMISVVFDVVISDLALSWLVVLNVFEIVSNPTALGSELQLISN